LRAADTPNGNPIDIRETSTVSTDTISIITANMDPSNSVNYFQRPRQNETIDKYRKDEITMNETDFYIGYKKRSETQSRSITTCNENGATMSMEYEARAHDIDGILINDDTYSYVFKFLRIRRELLIENESPNGVTPL